MLTLLDSVFNYRSITSLSVVYEFSYKSISRAGIPALLIPLLCWLYWGNIPIIYTGDILNYFFYVVNDGPSIIWLLPLFGFVGFDEVVDEIDLVMKYPRVSSREQEDGTSLEDQNDKLDAEIEKLDPEDTKIIGNEWESAKTMLRETIDEIVHEIQNAEGRYCLMFRNVDRLTRADPLEACVFLWIMKRNDVILYFDDLGYFDLSDLYQETMLIMQFVQSRDEYLNIRERGEQGIRKAKAKGEWPAAAPYGYRKDNDDHLLTRDNQAEVIQRGFELALHGDENLGVEKGNASQVHDQLKEEFETADVKVHAYSTLLEILRRRLYTGSIMHKGEAVGECPQIIPQDTFDKLQEVLEDREQVKNEEHLDHALIQVIERFGIDASLIMFEDVVKGRCPECGGDVRVWGSDTRMGKRVINYKCENHPDFLDEDEKSEDDALDDDDQYCDFEGPLLSSEFLRKWESSVPITCPACQLPLDDDAWEECVSKIGYIEQQCEYCSCGIAIDLSENKFERAGEVPSRIRFFDDSERDSDNSSGNDQTEDDDKSDNDDRDDSQSDLSDCF